MNINFQNVLKAVPQKTPTIWCMRQAGRYQKSYQKIRKKHSFGEICKTPELAATVSLNAVKEFDFDVAILFSDILFPLEALGFSLNYAESGAPNLAPVIQSAADLPPLKDVAEADYFLSFQLKALQATADILPHNKSLIGFIGGPYTLFSFATSQNKNFDTNLFSLLCGKLVPLLRSSIEAQLKNGAELVYIFDTLAGNLSFFDFKNFILPVLAELTNGLEDKVAYYTKAAGPDIFSTDLLSHFKGFILPSVFPIVPYFNQKPFVQGNFNEELLLSDTGDLKKALSKYLSPLQDLPMENRAKWVCSTGHGILKETPEDNVKLFVEFVREFFI